MAASHKYIATYLFSDVTYHVLEVVILKKYYRKRMATFRKHPANKVSDWLLNIKKL